MEYIFRTFVNLRSKNFQYKLKIKTDSIGKRKKVMDHFYNIDVGIWFKYFISTALNQLISCRKFLVGCIFNLPQV